MEHGISTGASSSVVESFADPVSFRDFCTTIEKGYDFKIIDTSSIDWTEPNLSSAHWRGSRIPWSMTIHRVLESITGFSKIWSEAERFAKRHHTSRPNRTEALKQYLRDKPGKVRLLTHESQSGSKAVALTPAHRIPILPTQGAMWLSLLRSKLALHYRFKSTEIATGLDMLLSEEDDKIVVDGKVGDIVNYRVAVTYRPERDISLYSSAELLRIICSNLTIAPSTLQSMSLPGNHDLGAARNRLDRFVTSQMKNLENFRDMLQTLASTESPNVSGELSQWLKRKKIDDRIIEFIQSEFEQNYEGRTLYDAFNAITSARQRIAGAHSTAATFLGELAGEFLEFHTEKNVASRWTLPVGAT